MASKHNKIIWGVGCIIFISAFFVITRSTVDVFHQQAFAQETGAFVQNAATVRCVNNLPEITLTWKSQTGALYYRIQRKNISSVPWSGILDSQIRDTRYVDVLWRSDYGVGTFFYRIEAVRSDVNVYSSEVSIAVPECRQSGTTPTPTPVTPPPTTVVPGKMPPWMKWGVYTGWQATSITEFEALTNKKPDMEMVFVHWGNETQFPFYYGARIRDKGRTMVLFWEASDYTRDPFTQPEFSFDAVLTGKLDSYFTNFAAGAKTYGGPIIIIPYSEFNGKWMPWGGGVGTNTPEKLIAAYRYLHKFFKDIPNVKFGWSPNNGSVPNIATNQMELYYPGDDVVDYVGVDGFNFGGVEEQTFAQAFSNSLTRLKQYNKPVYIFSFASAGGPGKAAWIKDALTVQLYKYPEVVGWLWFNQNKERDWRVSSDPNSLIEFVNALPSATGTPSPVPTTSAIPTGLLATTVSTSQINLSWNSSTANVGVTGYNIYRNGTQIASVVTTSYNDTNLLSGTSYSYTVSAIITGGSSSPQSSPVSATTTAVIIVPDTTRPTVSLSTPASGTTVSNTVTVSATASDNVGVIGVQFKIDNVNLGIEDTSTPYSVSWNTTSVGNGSHTLIAVARDNAGNTTTSVGSIVTVLNSIVLPLDTTPPTLSGITASNITTSSALISWTTNELAVSRVIYGTSSTLLTQQLNNSSPVTSHSMSLINLKRRTTYSYRVSSADTSGNTATSSLVTFTTTKGKPSTVNNLQASNGSVALSWEAPKNDFVARIEIYRSLLTYPTNTDSSSLLVTLTDPSATYYRDASVTAGVTYYYTVYTVDDLGIYSDPSKISFTTQAPPTSGSSGSSTGGVATGSLGSSGTSGGTTSSAGTTGGGGGGGGGSSASSGGGGGSGNGGVGDTLGSTTSSAGTANSAGTGGNAYPSASSQPANQQTNQPTTQQIISHSRLTGPFGIGQQSDEVKKLQEMLIADGSLSGEATGYYGQLTTQAVKKFQKKYNLVTTGAPDTTGYGLAGPGTRAKLNELYASTSSAQGAEGGGSGGISTDREVLVASLQKQVLELMKILKGLIEKLATLGVARSQ
ncbi:MAG: Ig-like domain-containing protein [bacterium]|nr:Ig-like domain-containing protein [bacterium]